jgi:glyoxylase-like metal-dependent hydrolase (beta-lactamase superfamily II)
MALHYKIIPVTPFQQNCSLIWCTETREAAVVDPGGDVDRIQAAIAAEGVILTKILLTHGHLDHVGGSAELAKTAGVPIIGPQREDAFWIDALGEQCRMFGFPQVPLFQPGQWLEEGDTVSVGKAVLEVIHTPGHTPGHIVFYCRSAQLALVGDVLFAGSIGRTDFPRGSHRQLLDSIYLKLWPLGREVEFIPGHGPMSTFGEEQDSNPFVAGRAG